MTSLCRLTAKDLTYAWPGSERRAVDSVCCHLQCGEIVALTGLSASGKTTFGMLLKGLLDPTQGNISTVEEDDTKHPASTDALRSIVGWSGAHPEVQLFASTVAEDVGFGAINRGFIGDKLSQQVDRALSWVGLDPARVRALHPLALSGGEKRRVALAGTVVMDYPFFVFDEPTAGLDPRGCQAFVGLIQTLKEQGRGILWITHDRRYFPQVADRVWEMREGRMVSPARWVGFQM